MKYVAKRSSRGEAQDVQIIGIFDGVETPMGWLRNWGEGDRHSPTGFEWGYYGSGPSALAWCMLYDYLKRVTQYDSQKLYEVATEHHQAFKSDIIAKQSHDGCLCVTSEQIDEWLKKQGNII